MAEESGLKEACGIFGCITCGEEGPLEVAPIIATGLVALQHRGQESAGIVTSFGGKDDFCQHRDLGMVSHVFKNSILQLKGDIGIGHTRYSTKGASNLVNCQPFVVETIHGKIAIAHNGELVNSKSLKNFVMNLGTGLISASDTELIAQILCHPPPNEEPENIPDWVARISNFMEKSPTSYSIIMMHRDKIFGFRDPYGNRPLCIGKLVSLDHLLNDDFSLSTSGDGRRLSVKDESGSLGWVVSSETCAFLSVGAVIHSYVRPGEIVEISRKGVKVLHKVERIMRYLKSPPSQGSEEHEKREVPQNQGAFCIFEYVYFARPDSFLDGQLVHYIREKCGGRLAIEHPVPGAHIISTVPESATPAAIGFAKKSGVPYAEVLCKNRYVGRTFIQPSDRLRKLNVAMKFGVLSDHVANKNIVLVDDSIVRGNTMKPIVRLLKMSGALEVHIRIASPPIKYPCFMGISIPTKEELIANQMSLQELEKFIEADSIRYISLEGLVSSINSGSSSSLSCSSPLSSFSPTNSFFSGSSPPISSSTSKKTDEGLCTACLTGSYPVEIEW